MANPVVGPTTVTETNNLDRSGSYWRKRIKWTQARPYNLNLAYTLTRYTTSYAKLFGSTSSFGGMANAAANRSPWQLVAGGSPFLNHFANEIAWADNSARAKLIGYLADPSIWLVNVIERRQAMEALLKRLNQLNRFVTALRRKNFYEAFAALDLHNVVRLSRRGGLQNTFLEFHFGWVPLVHDIWNTLTFFDSEIPVAQLKGRGKQQPLVLDWYKSLSGSPWFEYQRSAVRGWARSECGATLTVSNPNLYLLKTMGLTNPLAVAWELVPFSFVVDWFANIGDYFSQWSDFHGITISDPYTTTTVKANTSGEYHFLSSGVTQGWELDTQYLSCVRKLTLPDVTLGKAPGFRLSAARVITAAALFVQQLHRL